MYYNFRERNGKVDIIYHMRSSDYYEHFRNDIALAYLLLKYIATLSGKEVGSLYMTIDSLHAYKKDWGKLEIY
jgi:thymidylate synthase